MKRVVFFSVFLFVNGATVWPQAGKPGQTPKAPPAKPIGGAGAEAAAPPASKPAPEPKTRVDGDSSKQPAAIEPAKPPAGVSADQAKSKVEGLVREWFKRWNALDGTKESIDRFVELHNPDAVLLVSPREDQIGPAFYDGQALIRKMAEELSKQYKRITFFIKSRTEDEKTVEMITTALTPWGATAAAVEFGGGWDVRENGKRFMVPGAAFFEFENGKISRLRVYYAGGEIAPVTGAPTR